MHLFKASVYIAPNLFEWLQETINRQQCFKLKAFWKKQRRSFDSPYHKILWFDNNLYGKCLCHVDPRMCRLVCAAEDPEKIYKQMSTRVLQGSKKRFPGIAGLNLSQFIKFMTRLNHVTLRGSPLSRSNSTRRTNK